MSLRGRPQDGLFASFIRSDQLASGGKETAQSSRALHGLPRARGRVAVQGCHEQPL